MVCVVCWIGRDGTVIREWDIEQPVPARDVLAAVGSRDTSFSRHRPDRVVDDVCGGAIRRDFSADVFVGFSDEGGVG